MYNFTIPIDPRGKGRPRFSSGKFVRVYTDNKTRAYEDQLKAHITSHLLRELGSFSKVSSALMDYPVQVEVIFNIKRPKSVSEKKRKYPIVKPDIDNYIKALFDAMNGIVWKDDSLVVQCKVQKLYASKGSIEVTVSKMI